MHSCRLSILSTCSLYTDGSYMHVGYSTAQGKLHVFSYLALYVRQLTS